MDPDRGPPVGSQTPVHCGGAVAGNIPGLQSGFGGQTAISEEEQRPEVPPRGDLDARGSQSLTMECGTHQQGMARVISSGFGPEPVVFGGFQGSRIPKYPQGLLCLLEVK